MKAIRIIFYSSKNRNQVSDIYEQEVNKAILKNGSFNSLFRDRIKEAIDNNEPMYIEYTER